MYLQILVILLSIGTTVCDFLLIHESCQYWSYLKIYGDGEKKQLHCILDQNFQSGLVYTDWKMILGGTCPIYNRYAGDIDSITCNGHIGICPNESYPSYYGVTYTGCYEAIRKQTNVRSPATHEDVHVPPVTPDVCNCQTGLVQMIAIFASFVCIIVIALVWFKFRTKMKLCRENVIPEIGSNGECDFRTATANGTVYLAVSKLVTEKCEKVEIRNDKELTSLESNPEKVKSGNKSNGESGMGKIITDSIVYIDVSKLVANKCEQVEKRYGKQVAYHESKPGGTIRSNDACHIAIKHLESGRIRCLFCQDMTRDKDDMEENKRISGGSVCSGDPLVDEK